MAKEIEYKVIARPNARYWLIEHQKKTYLVDIADYHRLSTYVPSLKITGINGYLVDRTQRAALMAESVRLKKAPDGLEKSKYGWGLSALGVGLVGRDIDVNNTILVKLCLLSIIVGLFSYHWRKLKQPPVLIGGQRVTFIPGFRVAPSKYRRNLWALVGALLMQVIGGGVLVYELLAEQISLGTVIGAFFVVILPMLSPYFKPMKGPFYFVIRNQEE